MRINSDLFSSTMLDVDRLAVVWRHFCERRFATQLSDDHLDFLKLLWRMPGFTATEYRDSTGFVVASAAYRDAESGALFDMLAPWSLHSAWRRPGIFTAVMNLLAAGRDGMSYSLCYGRYSYKEHLVSGFEKVTL
jgi:hypothetical protein